MRPPLEEKSPALNTLNNNNNNKQQQRQQQDIIRKLALICLSARPWIWQAIEQTSLYAKSERHHDALFLSQKRTRQTHQVPGLSVHSQPIKGKCRKQKYQIICLCFLVKSDPVSGPSCNKTYGIQAIPCLWTDAFSGHSVTGLANSPSFVVVWRTLKKDELTWPPQSALYKGLYKSSQLRLETSLSFAVKLNTNQFFFTQLPPVEFASSFEHPWSSVAVLIRCRL